MKTITLAWPAQGFTRTTVFVPMEGVMLVFTVPAAERPRTGALALVSPRGIGEAMNMRVALSETPDGTPMAARYAVIPDSRSPNITFFITKTKARYPTLTPGQTYYAPVTPLRIPGDVVVDLKAMG